VPFSADSAVHELYSAPSVIGAVRERWGAGVLDRHGIVDRTAIASIVFNDPDERRWLEALLHPLVGEAWHSFVQQQQAGSTPPEFIVAEVPLLFEAQLQDRYDAVVTITAPLPLRIERARARDDGKRHSTARAAAQMPDQEKADRADFTYENTGSFDDLAAFAQHVMDALRSGPGLDA
jgi:dephospho-CoA kinase